MSRKYLKLFPEPVIDTDVLLEKPNQFCLQAGRKGKILEVAVFKKEENPVYRIFFEGDDFTTYVTSEDRFSKKNIYDLAYHLSGDTEICDTKSEKLIRKYFHTDEDAPSLLHVIEEYQRSIKAGKRAKRYIQEQKTLDEKMKLFRKPIPKGYTNFVRNKVYEKDFVLFYCRKKDTAYCTKCGTMHKLSEMVEMPKIGKTITCPSCKAQVKCKARIPVNGQTVCKWSLLIQTDGEDRVLLRYFCHSLTIKGYSVGEIRTKELQRSINDRQGTESFMWDDFHNTGLMRWCTYHDPVGYFTPSMWTYPTKGIYVYQRGLDKVLQVKRYRYSAFDAFCKAGYFPVAYTPENYLSQYLKKPFLEKLVKEGFHKLVSRAMDSWYGEQMIKGMNKNATEVKKLLNIDWITYQRLKRIGDPAYEEYKILKEFGFLNEANLKRLQAIPRVSMKAGEIRQMMQTEGITPTKFLRYVEENCPNDVDIYLDYLRCCFFLEYPRIPQYMYPKNLMEMHDRLSKERAQVQEQKQRELLEKKSKEMARRILEMEQETRFHMEDDAYVIVLPKDYEALQNESKILNHCVRQYIDQINSGSTMIFFIRKKQDIETPFFTLEIDKNLELVQCRTKHNKKAAEFDKEKGTHVQLFAESFQRQLIETARAS